MSVNSESAVIGFVICLQILSLGCADLGTPEVSSAYQKTDSQLLNRRRTISKQDLAILLPRDEELSLSAGDRGESGRRLLPREWLESVAAAYANTAAESAFEENWIDDWQLVSVRIAPCSPLGKRSGEEAKRFCWPEVRLVWQPNLYDHHIGWRIVDSFSDDRAIHALYHVYPTGQRQLSQEIIEAMKTEVERYSQPAEPTRAAFEELRAAALDELMSSVVRLRAVNAPALVYDELDLRYETVGTDSERENFYDAFLTFLDTHSQPANLHTLTSFSLPEGREPATADTWVFLAFEGADGQIRQKSIEIASPSTGQTLFDFGADETVASARGDHRLEEAVTRGGSRATELRELVVLEENDREKLADKINDPNQTLVANTSCGTCHSFNELAFNFHSLSYLQEMDMTIAPRVRNDVEYDLEWLRDNSDNHSGGW